MGSWFAALAKLSELRHPELWITRRFAVTAALLSAMTAFLCVFESPQKSVINLSLIPPCIAIAVVLCWLLGREVYWRSGTTRKLAVAYDGYRIPIDDWIRIRGELKHLCVSKNLISYVTIRLVTRMMVADEQTWGLTKKKYGFTALLNISHSPSVKDGSEPCWSFSFNATTRNAFVTELQELASASQGEAFISKVGVPRSASLSELLQFRARHLFEVVLLSLAIIEFTERKWAPAIAMLGVLDQELSRNSPAGKNPRRLVRLLRALCLSAGSAYPANAVPLQGELQRISRDSQEAVDKYGEEFPFLYNRQARNLFFLGELNEALRLANKSVDSNNEEVHKTCGLLNVAVLHLLLDHYKDAAAALRAFLASDSIFVFTWPDLIDFAELARHKYPQAIFLCGLYRKIFDPRDIHPLIQVDVEAWLKEEQARKELETIYRGKLPVISLSAAVKKPKPLSFNARKRMVRASR